jgi:hypothetical protein
VTERVVGVQACHAAYEITDEAAVYNCTGNPHPSDIEAIVQSMMKEEFETSFNRASFLLFRLRVFEDWLAQAFRRSSKKRVWRCKTSLLAFLSSSTPLNYLDLPASTSWTIWLR